MIQPSPVFQVFNVFPYSLETAPLYFAPRSFYPRRRPQFHQPWTNPGWRPISGPQHCLIRKDWRRSYSVELDTARTIGQVVRRKASQELFLGRYRPVVILVQTASAIGHRSCKTRAGQQRHRACDVPIALFFFFYCSWRVVGPDFRRASRRKRRSRGCFHYRIRIFKVRQYRNVYVCHLLSARSLQASSPVTYLEPCRKLRYVVSTGSCTAQEDLWLCTYVFPRTEDGNPNVSNIGYRESSLAKFFLIYRTMTSSDCYMATSWRRIHSRDMDVSSDLSPNDSLLVNMCAH